MDPILRRVALSLGISTPGGHVPLVSYANLPDVIADLRALGQARLAEDLRLIHSVGSSGSSQEALLYFRQLQADARRALFSGGPLGLGPDLRFSEGDMAEAVRRQGRYFRESPPIPSEIPGGRQHLEDLLRRALERAFVEGSVQVGSNFPYETGQRGPAGPNTQFFDRRGGLVPRPVFLPVRGPVVGELAPLPEVEVRLPRYSLTRWSPTPNFLDALRRVPQGPTNRQELLNHPQFGRYIRDLVTALIRDKAEDLGAAFRQNARALLRGNARAAAFRAGEAANLAYTYSRQVGGALVLAAGAYQVLFGNQSHLAGVNAGLDVPVPDPDAGYVPRFTYGPIVRREVDGRAELGFDPANVRLAEDSILDPLNPQRVAERRERERIEALSAYARNYLPQAQGESPMPPPYQYGGQPWSDTNFLLQYPRERWEEVLELRNQSPQANAEMIMEAEFALAQLGDAGVTNNSLVVARRQSGITRADLVYGGSSSGGCGCNEQPPPGPMCPVPSRGCNSRALVPICWKYRHMRVPGGHAVYLGEKIVAVFCRKKAANDAAKKLNDLVSDMGAAKTFSIQDVAGSLAAVLYAGSGQQGQLNGFVPPNQGTP